MKKLLLPLLSVVVFNVSAASNCPDIIGSYTCSEITEVFDIDGNIGRESNSELFDLDVVRKLNGQGVSYIKFNTSYVNRFQEYNRKSFFKPFNIDRANGVTTAELDLRKGSKAMNSQCILDPRAGKVIVQEESYIGKESYKGKHFVSKKNHFMKLDGDVLKVSTVNSIFTIPSELMADINLAEMYSMARFDKEALVEENIDFSSTTDQMNCVRKNN